MKNSNPKTVIVITGPTASGKTALAIQIARAFDTEIISADSRQCFREMAIGVARPSAAELAGVPHHFIASHSIHEEVTAATFEKFAIAKTAELFTKKDVVIVAGGTGLYIRAFCEGLDMIPEIDPAIRQDIVRQYEENGLEWLQTALRETDPEFYSTGEIKNPQRCMRALEVRLSTGKSILQFRTGNKADRGFRIIKTGLDLPKEILHRQIQNRVDKMMLEGLEAEVSSLYPFRHLNALQTVGYSELFSFLEGKTTREQAVEAIRIHTRQYAKRQLTWFRKDTGISWFAPHQAAALLEFIKESMQQY